MNRVLPVTYDELVQPLVAGGSVVGAAELHGCVSGALCAEPGIRSSDWVAEALPGHENAAIVAALQAPVQVMIEQTRAALAGSDMAFAPLLPPEDVALEERIAALAAWCDGFLYGIGRSGSLGQPPGTVDEIIRDLGEIARAAIGDEGESEEAERDYTELVEFVRAAVQLAFEELAPLRAAATRPVSQAANEETT